MKEKVIGTCKLCLGDGLELRESHLMPKGLYKRLLSDDDNPHPVLITEAGSHSTSSQVTDNVLCGKCEGLLDRNGENYALRMAAAKNRFRLLDELVPRSSPERQPEWRKSSVTDSPNIKRDQLIYFAISVFWRAAVHRWPDPGNTGQTVRIELGSGNTEILRKFLLGQGAIPRAMNLFFIVLTDKLSQGVLYLPSRSSKKHFRWGYGFVTCGYMFTLLLGKAVDPRSSQICLIHSPERFIWARDGELKTLEAFGQLFRRQAANTWPK